MRLKEVQGDHEAALTLGRRCLALFEKLFGPDSVEVRPLRTALHTCA
jgi:hypothetical protein